MTGKWSGDWANWANWPHFLNQIVAKSLPQYDSEPFRFTIEKENGNSVVHLKAADGQFLPLDVSVVSQNGMVMDTNSKPTAPGEFEVIFPNKPGMYFLRVKQTTEEGQDKLFQTGFSVPYSDEYLLKGTNRELLKELAVLTGGKELKTAKEAFRPLKQKPKRKESVSELLLLAAFLLLVLEILIRRLGFQPFLSLLFLLKKTSKKGEQGGTEVLQQLSMAKAKVKANAENKKELIKEEFKQETKKEKPEKQEKRIPVNMKKNVSVVSPEEKEDRMKRLLEAKKRKK
jgi:hypothetical protein